MRLTGEGEAGSQGGPSGDLYVVIHVREHEFLRRDGNDLICEIPVAMTTLALGGELDVAGIDAGELLRIPEGTQPGSTLKIKGKGMPDIGGNRVRGDLLVTVRGTVPKKLSKEQRALLEQLAATLAPENHSPVRTSDESESESIFSKLFR